MAKFLGRFIPVLLSLLLGMVAFGQDKGLIQVPTPQGNNLSLYTDSHALIIGISKYKNLPDNLQLAYGVKDATALRDVLVQSYGFPTKNITILTDEQATLTRIREALAHLTDNTRVKANDRVLIFFSGHGQTIPSPTGGEMGYLVPADAKVDLNNPSNAGPYNASCLRMKEVWDNLEGCPAKHVLVIADACFSGLLVRSRGGLSRESIAAMLSKPARQIISAGDKGQKAVERTDLGHGVFTAKLIANLKKRAGDKGRVFTASQLYAELLESVSNETGGKQTPKFGSFDTDGEFLFAPGGVADTTLEGQRISTEARLDVRSEPSGARVIVDGKPTGQTTPCTLIIDVDKPDGKPTEVKLDLTGYKPATYAVTLRRNQTSEVMGKLQALPKPAGDTKPVKPDPEPDTQPDTKPNPADAGGVLLAFQPQDKIKRTYKVTSQANVQGAQMSITADLSDIATTVGYGKIRLACTTSNLRISINGEPLEEIEPETTNYVLNSRGALLSIEDADEESGLDAAMQMLQSVTFPNRKVKVGDSWSTSTAGILGLPSVEGAYKIVGKETVLGQECFKITGTVKQTAGGPSSSSCTWWISIKEGMPVKFDGTFKKIPMPEVGLIDMKFQMTRVK